MMNSWLFLDIRPIAEGHALVIPKKEVDYFFDIDDAMLGRMMSFSKRIAKKLKQAVPCKKVGIMVAGLEVPHAHIHLVPIQSVLALNFANAKPAPREALEALLQKIKKAG